MKKHVNLIATSLLSTGLVLGGVGYVMVSQNQDIVNKINLNCKNTEIIDAPLYYDVELFNKCDENGYLLVTLECWKDIHPAFKTIPLSSGESMPYGAIYSKEPSEDALRFLDIIKEVISE